MFTHASWTERRSESYERLAFLGDSVLGLAVTDYLYPRFEAERFGAGRLTKLRAQTVSGRSCMAVAERLGLPERLLAAAPQRTSSTARALVGTERVLASVMEAVIGACYLAYGFERTAAAVVEAFEPQVQEALDHPGDSKSALQELLARRGALVEYTVVERGGAAARPHLRGRGDGGRGRGRPRIGPQQEGRRTGGRHAGARGARGAGGVRARCT